MNTRVLLTGGRAPATLHLSRMLNQIGCHVYVAESEKHHLCNVSNSVKQSFLVPKPNEDYQGYIHALSSILTQKHIEILIPTCEEVFHIAKSKEVLERSGAKVFCDSVEKLKMLHNKWDFIQFLIRHGYPIPKTKRVDSKKELQIFLNQPHCKVVIKPIYSRFASNVYILSEHTPAPEITISPQNPWVIQEFIQGTQYCSYSVAVDGKLLAHTCYKTKYTAGLGANVYFKHVDEIKILEFVKKLVADIHYTGQIAFDFFIQDNILYPIECNPRATSGIHLFDGNLDFPKTLFELSSNLIIPNNKNTFKLGIPMLVYGLNQGYLFRKPIEFIKDFCQAKDTIYNRRDKKPYFYQTLIFLSLLSRKLKYHKGFTELTTADIEWSGDL